MKGGSVSIIPAAFVLSAEESCVTRKSMMAQLIESTLMGKEQEHHSIKVSISAKNAAISATISHYQSQINRSNEYTCCGTFRPERLKHAKIRAVMISSLETCYG